MPLLDIHDTFPPCVIIFAELRGDTTTDVDRHGGMSSHPRRWRYGRPVDQVD